jgi:DNA-binding transcriptional MerR regulator
MKEKQLFSIGEVAEMKGLTVKALRFYEEIGLLQPYKIDVFTKYRYYHRDQFLVIELIKAARGMDVSPNDLVSFVKNKDTAGLLSFIGKHREEQTQKLLRLRSLLDHLDGVTSVLNHAQEIDGKSDVYLRTLPDRHLLTRWIDSPKVLADSERSISELELLAEKRHLSGTYESGALFERQSEEAPFAPTFLFTTVLNPFEGPDYKLLPGGLYACVLVNEKNAVSQSEKMQKYLVENLYDVSLITQVELLRDLFGKENPVEMQWKIIKLP